uniref:Uncharacterized protein n=1 Tax=Timema shepardi TaxID=629360 RepID=A0A7R9FXT4_TIMSH|nr:unnamed protein product [Timema shepardi]
MACALLLALFAEFITAQSGETGLVPPVGYCAPYNGKVCKHFLNGTGSVWFNISHEYAGGWLNEQITAGLWDEMITSLKEPCRSAAELFSRFAAVLQTNEKGKLQEHLKRFSEAVKSCKSFSCSHCFNVIFHLFDLQHTGEIEVRISKLLCTYAFPQCVLRDSYPVGLPLCAEDCVAVRQLFCYNDWALIEDNKHRGIYFKSRGHFQLPNCETLPGFRGSTQSICSNARLTEMKVDEVTYDCVIGRGRFYQGTVNVTKYGLPCQYWDSQEPHSHYRPPDVFPEMKNAENYCRNAGGEEPSPWCYTLDPAVRWQRCDIPICATTPLTLQVHIHVHVHYLTKGQFHSQV